MRLVLSELAMLLLVTLAALLCTAQFGYLERTGLHLEILGGIIVALLLRAAWRRFRVRPQASRRRIALEILAFLLVAEAFILFMHPYSSVVPATLLDKTGVIHLMPASCTDDQFTLARSIWGDQIDYDRVRVMQGGDMYNLDRLQRLSLAPDGYGRAAAAFGAGIYVVDDGCMPDSTFVHEMTHIWQFQNLRTHFHGIETVPAWIRFFYLQFADSDPLYDYGGKAGLMRAKAAGIPFYAFGIEQQATIIEHWATMRLPEGINDPAYRVLVTDPEYMALLDHYAASMLAERP